MKFSIIIASALFFSAVMAAPISEETGSSNSTALPKASITITNPTVVPPPSAVVGDTMSGTTAIASITIKGHDATAQSVSASSHNFVVGPAIVLPIAIISALALV